MAKMDLTARLKSSAKRAQEVTVHPQTAEHEPAPVKAEVVTEGPVLDVEHGQTNAPVKERPQLDVPAVDEASPASDDPLTEPVRRRPAPTTTRRAPAKAPATPMVIAGESVKGLALELPRSLNDRLNAHRAASKMSFVLIVMTAVEVAYPRLQELIDEKLGRHNEPARVSLFAKPTRQRISHDEETERRTIRMSAGALEVLDGLVEEFTAPSRTFLVIVALDTYLPATN